MFVHHPDGYFVIAGEIIEGRAFMQAEPGYNLPARAIGRIYEPGVRHHLILANGQQPQPLDWAEGNRYIANKDRYRRMAARLQNRQAIKELRRGIARSNPILERKVRRHDRQQQRRIFRGISRSRGRNADRPGKGTRSSR